ncbi:hypothetical protein SLEP1_g963 [Rubroshorea leprosula]|nr:hypothetical protein SLEP1_g963 [Rubroshorea leprosula]
MEISFPTTPAAGYFRSSTETSLLQRIKLPSWHRYGAYISLSQRTKQPLLSTRAVSPVLRESRFKVLCIQNKQVPVLEARHIVGLAGPPGAGKSTLANAVVQRVNKLWPAKANSFDSQVKPPDVAIVLPMDGFHLYRSQLDAMENPEEAHARRGAPWTYNPTLLFNCLKNLRNQGSVYAPSFDHGVGDPVEDDIFVSLQHKVVIVEGNYLCLEEGVWKDVSSIFDEKW